MNWIAKKIWIPIFNRLGLTEENALRFREWSKGKVGYKFLCGYLYFGLWEF